MSDLELSDWFSSKGKTKTQELAAGRTRTYVGVALSNSSNGYVSVDMGGDNVSADESQGLEISCTPSVKQGDKVVITVVNGSPVVTGVAGWGDEIEREVVDAGKTATNYLKFIEGVGLIVGDMAEESLGANVKIDSDSVDIRYGDMDLVTTEAVEKTENAVYPGYVGLNYPASTVIDTHWNNGYTLLESTYRVHGQELFDLLGNVRTKIAYKKAKTDYIDVVNNGFEVYDETDALALFLGMAQVSTDVSNLLQSLKEFFVYVNGKFSLNVFKDGLIANSLDIWVDNNGDPKVEVLSPEAWRHALDLDNAIITRQYEFGSLVVTAGAIGSRASQVTKSITVSGYTPIGVNIIYINGSDSFHPIAFMNQDKTILYMNAYRATDAAINKTSNCFTAEVVYVKTSLL